MRSLWLIVIITLGCVKAKPSSDTQTKDFGTNCECNDMACWNKATNDGVRDQLSCVQSALGAAANVASAGAYSTAQLLIAVSDIYRAANATFKIASQGSTAVNLLDLIKAVAEGNGDTLKEVFGANYVNSPGLNCLKNGSDILKNLTEATSSVMKISSSDDNIKSIIDLMKATGAGLDVAVQAITLLDNCAAAINGPSDEAGSTLKAFSGAWKNFMAAYKTVTAFVECGWNISKGGVTLVQNSICAWDDIKGWRESAAAVDAANQDALNRPAPNQGTSPENACNAEPTSCNHFAMRKMGLWVSQQTYWSYFSKSTLCSDMCANAGRGPVECKKYAGVRAKQWYVTKQTRNWILGQILYEFVLTWSMRELKLDIHLAAGAGDNATRRSQQNPR